MKNLIGIILFAAFAVTAEVNIDQSHLGPSVMDLFQQTTATQNQNIPNAD